MNIRSLIMQNSIINGNQEISPQLNHVFSRKKINRIF